MSRAIRNGLSVVCCAVGLTAFAGQAESGVLYATQFSGSAGIVIDTDTGTVLHNFTTTGPSQTGLAVGSTIRAIPSNTSVPGSEYDLSGNVVNSGIYSNTGYASLYDGTTDGTYNYAIDHNGNGTNTVFRFDQDWSNGVVLFHTTQRGSGITYDASTNTLWTTEGASSPTGVVRQYDMAGNQLSQFTNALTSYSIAWDGTDDTLWVSRYGTNDLYHYQKDGSFLGVTDFGAQMFLNPFGLEFALAETVSVPNIHPGLHLAVAAGTLFLARRRRRLA